MPNLTLTQAGAIKGVHRITVKNWITTGKIPADMLSRVGKRWVIDEEKWRGWTPTHNPNGGQPKGKISPEQIKAGQKKYGSIVKFAKAEGVKVQALWNVNAKHNRTLKSD